MAKRTSPPKTTETTHFRHEDAKRKNIPTAAMEAEGQLPKARRVKYAYSPHLEPVLRFDPAGRADRVRAIVDKACRGERLDKSEQEILHAVGQNWERPWLEWAGKQEEHARGYFGLDPVALHIHERISAQAILRNAMREPREPSLFAVPDQTYAEALQFYRHDIDWANRLILGDSLQVMSSLAQRENLAGKVQMIYMDPPYGITFASNFQPELGKRDVKDGRDDDLTREPEMVRAYRDTWHLGTSSYLAYLRARLLASRELLSMEGSVFVQISDENLHRVRMVMDEVFGADNFVSLISFQKTGSIATNRLPSTVDYLIWFARDASLVTYRPQFLQRRDGHPSLDRYDQLRLPSGEHRSASTGSDGDRLQLTSLVSDGATSGDSAFRMHGRTVSPGRNSHWKTTLNGLRRLSSADRLMYQGERPRYVRFAQDFPLVPLDDRWESVQAGKASLYVVQTSEAVIERCLLMTTAPGDLVVDPTCGSGTTAYVAEQWGRRWITTDTSRVALSIARQRVLTAKFAHFKTKGGPSGSLGAENPSSGFEYKTIPHVTLKSIAQNANLDPIFAKHDPILAAGLDAANRALAAIPATLRNKLKAKLAAKQRAEGKKSISDADRRRWVLPPDNRAPNEGSTVDATFAGWYNWEVPFDTDPDWPSLLQETVTAYRAAWRAKMDEVNKCIADNAEQEELVDQPEVVRNVVRVSGPFTVEGVIPEELSISDDGMFDPTSNDFEDCSHSADPQNLSAYFSRMLAHLKADGLTFLNNQRKFLDDLSPIFEDASGSFLHAEGKWKDETASLVAVTFGPQYGPVTALQVEEAIRAAKRYTDLVLCGFGFDAETYAIVEAQQHPKLRIHIAQIRPDLNDSMDGLLKNTPNSQLFTVFGQPEIDVKHTKEGWVCTLKGVDIYNPTDNTLRSSGADKVSAWFLDSDYDGRCFCATQAFFPNRDAWEKIAKALGDQANAEAFEAFSGTTSLPFEKGKFGRIAVKVIDPRGNEVMAIRTLK